MKPVTVSLADATIRFDDDVVLDRFSGSFEPGTVNALIGADGAGKSTLLRLLAGRLSLDSGTSTGLPVPPNAIGYQPTDSGTWRNLSVKENIEFVAHAYGLSPARTRARADELLARAGLDHVRDRLAGRLSGGMRQKLGVVLATLHEPSLVLLDEPTTGVDPISRAELWSLIASAAVEGATVVFATTYLDEAERATNLFLLGDGHLLAAGAPDAVIDPQLGSLEKTSVALLLAAGADTRVPAVSESVPANRTGQTHRTGPLAQASSVTRTYGDFTALNGVSLEVNAGEIVGLLGGNGAGKTTLIRTMLGLETPTSGTTTAFGAEPSLTTRRHIGYVAQGLGLYPTLSASENLAFAASVQGVTVGEHADSYARSCGRTPVGSLPLGTRRILAFLAATVHHPELLILDEPTSGMDSLGRARLWEELRALADRGTGILVTTHYMQEAAQCDRLVILTSGQVTGSGSIADITASHRSLVISSDQWGAAFTAVRDAGLPAMLDGRRVRVPGVERSRVEEVLRGIPYELSEETATLEETMLLAAR